MVQAALMEEHSLLLGTLEDAMEAECQAEELEKQAQALREKVQEILNEHIRAGVFAEGPFKIIEEVSSRRLVDIEKLKRWFPDIFRSVARQKYTASVGDVEKNTQRSGPCRSGHGARDQKDPAGLGLSGEG